MNIYSEIRVTDVKTRVRIKKSGKILSNPADTRIIRPANRTNKPKTSKKRILFKSDFTRKYHLIKSLTAKYIAEITPNSERIAVNTGVWKPASLSSLMPPQVVTAIIATI